METVKCKICNGEDLKSVMLRIKGNGYTHQTCISTAIAYLRVNLRSVTYTDIQEFILQNKGYDI